MYRKQNKNGIPHDQTGFFEGRFTGKNTRLVYDILQYTDENSIPELLLLFDFEKKLLIHYFGSLYKVVEDTLSFSLFFIKRLVV